MSKRGAPKKPTMLKKYQIGVSLPYWMIVKLREIRTPRQKIIEQALIEKYGWTQDDIDVSKQPPNFL